jgi:hypothetical protein
MTKKQVRFVHEGRYAAEITVDVTEVEGGWAPYLSFEDVTRLADAKAALRRGDVAAAAQFGRVFELLPVTA